MIGDVIREVRAEGFPVVVVDDCSRDNSGAIARDAGAVVVRHATNLGQGAALQTGIEFALRRGATFLVTFDADGQHRIEDAIGMLDLAQHDGLGFVFGSRFLDDRTQTGTLKRLVLRFAAWFTRKSTGMELTDATTACESSARTSRAGLTCTRTGWRTLPRSSASSAGPGSGGPSIRSTCCTPTTREARDRACGTPSTSLSTSCSGRSTC